MSDLDGANAYDSRGNPIKLGISGGNLTTPDNEAWEWLDGLIISTEYYNREMVYKTFNYDELKQAILAHLQKVEIDSRVDEAWRAYTHHNPNTTHKEFLDYLNVRLKQLKEERGKK